MNYEKIMTEIKSVREFKKQAVDSNLLSLIDKIFLTTSNRYSSRFLVGIIIDKKISFIV